jgi:general secretion pathway protein G
MSRGKRAPRQRHNRSHGFTLMEVLLVLAILVILGTLAATNFQKVFSSAKEDAAKNQLNEFKTPLSIYQMDVGVYPDQNQGLQALRVAPADVDAAKWRGPYLGTDIPSDPWDHPYVYEGGGDVYKIYSVGKDGQGNTEDDIIIQSGT